MPAYSNILEPYQRAAHRLATLSGSHIEALRMTLEAVRPTVKPNVLGQRVQEALGTRVKDAAKLVEALFHLNTIRSSSDTPVEAFVAEVVEAMMQEKPPPKFDSAKFTRNLIALLKIDSITVSTRAYDIQHEYEKVFDSARILTDIRPVFDPVTATKARGAMVIHNLKVTFYEDGDYREIYLAMDNADLAMLRKAVDRAETKTATLAEMIQAAGSEYFESK